MNRIVGRGAGPAVVLLGAGAGYGGGNVGPAANAIAREFGVSLSTDWCAASGRERSSRCVVCSPARGARRAL